jgi:hypothetical protein
MSDFLKNLKAAADATGTNQSEVKSGDFEKVIYPEGGVRLRFVSYVELGKHEKVWKGVKKTPNLVRFGFEVSGPRHKPVVGNDGIPRPLIVYVEETLSQDPKANFVKLFSLLNHARSAEHAAYLLGEPYIGKLVHRRFKRKSDPVDPEKWTGLEYKLRDENGFTIRPPFREDDDTGEMLPVQVDPAVTPISGFLWDAPTKEQWDSIFVEGEFPERKNAAGEVVAPAKSKNVTQERIMRAVNFKGSPIYSLLAKAGVNLDLAPPPADEDEDASGESTTATTEAKPTPATPAKVASGTTPPAGADIDDDIPW